MKSAAGEKAKECRSRANAGEGSPALVVFAGEASITWLRLLRPGYRHCFVLLQQQDFWLIYDPLSHRTELQVIVGPTAHELTCWYQGYGLRVVETHVRRTPSRPAVLRPFTCVEAVKSVLGIHAPWVATPWQLYRHLLRTG